MPAHAVAPTTRHPRHCLSPGTTEDGWQTPATSGSLTQTLERTTPPATALDLGNQAKHYAAVMPRHPVVDPGSDRSQSTPTSIAASRGAPRPLLAPRSCHSTWTHRSCLTAYRRGIGRIERAPVDPGLAGCASHSVTPHWPDHRALPLQDRLEPGEPIQTPPSTSQST
ncbi:hypothetical protein D3C75_723840 [compost metagenome]